jgi:hypothetical protein
LYGEYLGSVLDEARRPGLGKFRHVKTRAVGVRVLKEKIAVETEPSGVLNADALILATGNAAPRRLAKPLPGGGFERALL